jgi:Flp pilus assembly protein TadB
LVGGPVVRPGASKEERKAAKTAQRKAMADERNRSREALLTGDERHLPERDKGPARKFARDYVDARRGIGEYFLIFAVVVLGLSVIPSRIVNVASIVLLYAVVLAVAVDSFLLRRRVGRLTVAKYGDKAAGVGTYAMMRSLQLRRTRLPRPQVQRGQFPS